MKKISRLQLTEVGIFLALIIGVPMLIILFLFGSRTELAKSAYDDPLLDTILQDYYKDSPTRANFSGNEVTNRTELDSYVQKSIATHTGRYAVYMQSFTKNDSVTYNENEKFTLASLAKLVTAVVYYSKYNFGDSSMDAQIAAMMKTSDNGAFDQVLQRIQISTIETFLKDNNISSNEIDFESNEGTASGIMKILLLLKESSYIDQTERQFLYSNMTHTKFEDRLPYLLPDTAQVAHKVGQYGSAYNDAGIILSDNHEQFAVVVLTEDGETSNEIEYIQNTSLALYQYYINTKL